MNTDVMIMTRWRIVEPDPVTTSLPSGCSPYLVVRPDGSLIERFACREGDRRLCPCLFDALLKAREYTLATSVVCVAIRESDGKVIARTGPKRSESASGMGEKKRGKEED